MGRIILCKGKYAKTPYYFRKTQTNVCSIEEVCYYIKNNIYLLKKDYFGEAFCEWLDVEVGLTELSEKVLDLIKSDAQLKEIIRTICSGCDYYSAKEIDEIVEIIENTADLDEIGKLKIKADNHFKLNELKKAYGEYNRMISNSRFNEKSNDEVSFVYNRIGMIELCFGNYDNALKAFKRAYIRKNDFNSLNGINISIRFLSEDGISGECLGSQFAEKRNEVMEELGCDPMEVLKSDELWEYMYGCAENSMLYGMANGIKNSIISHREAEYNMRAYETIDKLKEEFRMFDKG